MTFATVPGYKGRSDESQRSKDAEIAQAKKDLEKYTGKAADKVRLMDQYKKKYVLNIG